MTFYPLPTVPPPSAVEDAEQRRQLTAAIKRQALALGFDSVGIAAATPFGDARAALLARINAGYFSGLSWFTAERADVATDPTNLLPEARSIIAVAMSYAGEASPPDVVRGHHAGVCLAMPGDTIITTCSRSACLLWCATSSRSVARLTCPWETSTRGDVAATAR